MKNSNAILLLQTCKWYVYIFPHKHKRHTGIRSTQDVKTNQNHIFSNTHLNTDVKSNQTHIFHIHHEVLFLNVTHVKERKTLYVYLLQGAEAAEDWVRQWYQLIAREPQRPVGRREDRVRLKLVAIAAPSCVPQCVCACQCVCVLTSRNKHVNRAHTPQRS